MMLIACIPSTAPEKLVKEYMALLKSMKYQDILLDSARKLKMGRYQQSAKNIWPNPHSKWLTNLKIQ